MSISQLLFVYNYLFFLDANGSCPCMVCGGTLDSFINFWPPFQSHSDSEKKIMATDTGP